MRFSTAAIGLLFGLEAVALKAVPRTVPEIERAVCTRSCKRRAQQAYRNSHPKMVSLDA
jgi:hypothetical protein